MTNLEACINYCAFYEGCEALYFEGGNGSVGDGEIRPVANCYPLSSNGTVSQGTLASSAILQGTCNVSSSVSVLVSRCLCPPIVARQSVRYAEEVVGWVATGLLE